LPFVPIQFRLTSLGGAVSINQPFRQHKAREARRIIKEQLAGVADDDVDVEPRQLTESELRQLEIEDDRHTTIINGNNPDDYDRCRYETLDEYNEALETLMWHITDEEQLIVSEVRKRIRRDQEWHSLWLADYYADRHEEEARFTASI